MASLAETCYNFRMANELYEASIKYVKNGEYESGFECIKALYLKATTWGEKRAARNVVIGFRKAMKGVMERSTGVVVSTVYDLLRSSYDLTAVDYFDDFMIALEWDRAPEDRFWTVRRECLLPVADELQALEEDRLDELFLSCPPRIGKSTIVMFFVIWQMCKYPEESNLYSSFTEKVVKTFYSGVLEVLDDAVTYRLKAIFPKAVVASTNAQDLLINIGRKKRYATLTCRSVDGSLNGSCDCSHLLIADDLHSGIDEARSKDQLIKKWETVRANLLSRKKGNAKILWIGTRWSLIDCISNRIEMLENDAACRWIRHKVFNLPALNEKEESNFDYMFHKGFTTADYKAIRASYEIKGDEALWLAPYMGTPIERDGAVFSPDELRYYNGELPKKDGEAVEPDRRYMVVDPAWGGGDYVAAVVVYQYDEDLFVVDVVYNNADKSVTEPEIAAKVKKWLVDALYIESTRVTMSYADEVDKRLREDGYRVNINGNVKNWNGQEGKTQRIYNRAPEIREKFVFLDKTKWSKAYTQFMQNVFSFVVEGKNKHDDAPDVLAMTLTNAYRPMAKIKIISAGVLDSY